MKKCLLGILIHTLQLVNSGFAFANGADSILVKRNSLYSTCLSQDLLNELNFQYDFFLGPQWSIGVEAGYVWPNPLFRINKLAMDQGAFPGTIYHGPAIHFFNTNFYRTADGTRRFVREQFLYKRLSYNDHEFENIEKDEFYYFTRSETCDELGFDLLFGKLKPNHHHNFREFYLGFGIRHRARRGVTTRNNGMNFSPGAPIGAFDIGQTFFVVNWGFKLGVCRYKGK